MLHNPYSLLSSLLSSLLPSLPVRFVYSVRSVQCLYLWYLLQMPVQTSSYILILTCSGICFLLKYFICYKNITDNISYYYSFVKFMFPATFSNHRQSSTQHPIHKSKYLFCIQKVPKHCRSGADNHLCCFTFMLLYILHN